MQNLHKFSFYIFFSIIKKKKKEKLNADLDF